MPPRGAGGAGENLVEVAVAAGRQGPELFDGAQVGGLGAVCGLLGVGDQLPLLHRVAQATEGPVEACDVLARNTDRPPVLTTLLDHVHTSTDKPARARRTGSRRRRGTGAACSTVACLTRPVNSAARSLTVCFTPALRSGSWLRGFPDTR